MKIARTASLICVAAVVLAACQSGAAIRPSETVRGGLASSDIGRGLNFMDRSKALKAEYQALEFGTTGAPISWTGWGGRRGSVIPGPSYRINSANCRDYTHTIYVNDEAAEARGTACRSENGNWSPAA